MVWFTLNNTTSLFHSLSVLDYVKETMLTKACASSADRGVGYFDQMSLYFYGADPPRPVASLNPPSITQSFKMYSPHVRALAYSLNQVRHG